ncbi:MAG: GNAT family N-acetyltransferase [Miniphocaeibacter sp.]|uniref:GNAT family N-acetyltransferase n=1 Tax=Miniphocaeibacter sp. TaxID=3100973 RepID=UPI00182AC235|nr:GNAT family N-acetyltransferase [Gallicola sp.]
MKKNIVIREYKKEDLNTIMDIWLNSNLDAHNFIEEEYWKKNFQYVKDILPKANIRVAILEDKIVGFIGIVDSYIAGIFISREYRSLGIGKLLLKAAKENYSRLSLDVYRKNKRAYEFYLNNGFIVKEEKNDKENKEIEYFMVYEKNHRRH